MVDLSVIIVTYNRCEILSLTLSSFLKLKKLPFDYEILVIDNNSNDLTKCVVDNFSTILPLRYVFEPKQGQNNGRNAGITQALGGVLVYIDDDISVDEKWISSVFESTLRFPEGKFFGGKIFPSFPVGTSDWKKNSSYSSFVYAIHDLGEDEVVYPDKSSPCGGHFWIRSEVFSENLKFDDHIGPYKNKRISGGEIEFFERLKTFGIKPIYVPSAVVTHRIQPFQTSKRYLLKRSYASGRGFVYIYRNSSYPLILGVPRFLLRQFIENCFSSISFYIKGDIKSSFERLMTASHRLGCIKQYRDFLKVNK